MSLYTPEERNRVILILTILLGAVLAYALRDIFNALLGALLFYTIFRPFHLFLVKKHKVKAWLSSTLLIILSFFIIVVPFFLLVTMVVNKVSKIDKETVELEKIFSAVNEFAAEKLNQPNLIDDILSKIQAGAMNIFSAVLSSTFHILLLLVIMYFLLYFMFADYKRFERSLLQYVPFSRRTSLLFARELRNITYSNVLGQGFIALVQGGLVALSFVIFGLDDALFWGVISMFLSFLPIVGPTMIFIPAGLIEISNGNNFAGLGVIIWGFVLVVNIDNVLRLFIAKWVGNIHPIVTIIGVVIGIPLFGIVGLVFGPLLLSFFVLLVNVFQSNKKTIADEPKT